MPSVSFTRPAPAVAAPAVAAPAGSPTADDIARARALLASVTPAASTPVAAVETQVVGKQYNSPTEAFDKENGIPARPTPVSETTTLVPGTAAAPSAVTPYTNDGDLEGEFGLGDIRLPRINLVQKSGKLGDDFRPGEITFAKAVILPQPLDFIVLHIRKQYQEKIPWALKDTQQARICDTAVEVANNGGKIGFGNYEYSDLGHLFMLVAAPKGLNEQPDAEQIIDMFMYELTGIEGKWAPVVMTCGSSSYSSMVKTILTARQFQLKEGIHFGRWSLKSEKRTKGDNTWYVPVPTFKGKIPEEAAAMALTLKKGE